MDYGTLRGLFALLILALFIIIVVWSYSKKRKSSFDEVANSIFEEDKVLKEQATKENKNNHLETDSKQETNKNV
ncbi:CcoQ/FixQ family Cbb3-type cytochrome c oxidase assembly chaperone [Colwellia sp. MSW7]|jgi:cytochrome c oxidase cbb3-type subunit 4|uniref:CcoQ/FixQ family Cbb3-type cytochrome c oxidase assembly chaperone n=1 Tax=Colwellia maritima TaxID=2912588 RepID=A0ABS9X2Q3_9GAMM|nr:CcoQ/FixQ family Cbb3-type cytochrome c oxidase assembly chaperone [Colwellia maritima]MCI2284523.1 CcoQ/FixQ family Cbb3-type cytochrome c oxidase assembly chaperone [Colwellia maritima]